jgi:hypothetical protein
MVPMETVASARFNGVHPSGERIVVELSIGKPYQRADDLWACPISLTPLYRKLADSSSDNPVHALCLALSLALDLLAGFREDGGRLEFDDGTEVPLEAYAFGASEKGTGNAV